MKHIFYFLLITLVLFSFAKTTQIVKTKFEYQDTAADYLMRFVLDTSKKEITLDITSQNRPIYIDTVFTVNFGKDSVNNFKLQYRNTRFNSEATKPLYAYRIRPFVKKTFKINYKKLEYDSKKEWIGEDASIFKGYAYFSIDFYYLDNVNKLKYSEVRGGIMLDNTDYKRKATRTFVIRSLE